MVTDEREIWLDEAVRELRAPVPDELRSREHVLERLRNEIRPAAGRFREGGNWFVRPRPIAVSPLGALCGVTVLVAVVVLGMHLVLGHGTVRRPAPGTAVSGIPAAARVRPVHFKIVAPEAVSVFVVGDFNDWDPRATPLVRSDPSGAWTVAVALEPGLYQYSYVVDGHIRAGGAGTLLSPADEFGAESSVILVEGTS
jgi:hypothetical protein